METAGFELEQMQASAADACRLLKVLANPDRLLILCQLAQGEKRVAELEALLGIVQPTLSQQLTVLRDEGLVSTRRDGKSIYYQLSSPRALAVMRVLYQEFCQVPADLENLEDLAETANSADSPKSTHSTHSN